MLAFEAAVFPSWNRWFNASSPPDVLFARDRTGNITGTLLLHGPGAKTVFAPMLGTAAGVIGCVGVAPHRQGEGIGTALVVRASEVLRDADPQLPHWLDGPRILLPPRRLPALATIRHVLQPCLTYPATCSYQPG